MDMRPYLNLNEAAKVLNTSVSMVHVFDRRGILTAHYPDSRRAGKHFLREDVYALAELRKLGIDKNSDQMVMRALVASRRAEKKVDDLMFYLGFNEEALGTEKTEVVAFFIRAEESLKEPKIHGPEDVRRWARKIQAITEEYLELVHAYTGEPEPWKVFLDLARQLASISEPGSPERVFMDHARANLRNVAYFYLRTYKGPRQADKAFPNERYSGKLISRMYPL